MSGTEEPTAVGRGGRVLCPSSQCEAKPTDAQGSDADVDCMAMVAQRESREGPRAALSRLGTGS